MKTAAARASGFVILASYRNRAASLQRLRCIFHALGTAGVRESLRRKRTAAEVAALRANRMLDSSGIAGQPFIARSGRTKAA
jgi:hypothetical protein